MEHSSGSAVCEDPEWTVLGTRGRLVGRGAKLTLKYLDPPQEAQAPAP